MSLNLSAACATRSRGLHSKDHGRFSRPWKSSDLILKVAKREFHVHRAVLMLCSPVFEAMLSLEFKEKSAQKIPLPGKDATEIEQMLQGIYPDQDLWISKENCLFLLKLSTEYQIDRLKTRCEEYLSHWCEDGMNIDEAMEVIIVSQRYNVEEWIVKRCVDRFVSQTDKTWVQLQQHKRFSELEPSNVKHITEKRMAFLERRSSIGFPFAVVSSSRSCRKYGPVDMRNNFRV
ncbi:speckle-type POZ protein-like [Porites lutea]|uniref:speckle-type POZ protein-like n=1 Tax=Porites lutea TaxID=51062 RepID=UPI003CC59B0A